jgi:ferredoxin-NADP reductase
LNFGVAYTFRNGIIEQILDETPNVKRFFIRIPELNQFDFNAGQFIMLDLPINSKITNRAYSIASAPGQSNLIELVVVLKDGGLDTTYLFGKVGEGSSIKISDPIGKFTRPRPERFNEPLCFICTGTGIAPFRSMIHDILNNNVPFHSIHLIKGSRLPEDILYKDEMEALSNKIDNFHFHPVLSRAENHNWSGHRGYVHELYPGIAKEFPETLFYICGWKEMIFETKKNLLELGIQKEKIRFEVYD